MPACSRGFPFQRKRKVDGKTVKGKDFFIQIPMKGGRRQSPDLIGDLRCRGWESNPHDPCGSQNCETCASPCPP